LMAIVINHPNFSDMNTLKLENPTSAFSLNKMVKATNKMVITAAGIKTGFEMSKYLVV